MVAEPYKSLILEPRFSGLRSDLSDLVDEPRTKLPYEALATLAVSLSLLRSALLDWRAARQADRDAVNRLLERVELLDIHMQVWRPRMRRQSMHIAGTSTSSNHPEESHVAPNDRIRPPSP